MRTQKIKLGDYDIPIVINGLTQYRKAAPDADLDVIEPMLLRLIRVLKDLKPGKRTKCLFRPAEKLLVRFYLNEWRDLLIQENNLGSMDGVTDVMLKFS